MLKPLSVLNIEDSKSDSDLIAGLLKKAGYKISLEQVETDAQLRAALKSRAWDIVISNHGLPQFDSFTALTLLHEEGMDIPFIAYSGAIGEETVVDLMKAGAHDYLMRDNLTRLVPAVERELEQVKSRRERKLIDSTYRNVVENSVQGVAIYQGKKMVFANSAICRIFGYTSKELMAMSEEQLVAITHPDDRAISQERARKRKAGKAVSPNIEVRILRKDGSTGWVRAFNDQITFDGQPAILSTLIDITESKHSVEALHASEKRFRALIENSADAITLLDAQGSVIYDSPAAPGMLGYGPEDWIGQSILELIHPDDLHETRELLQNVISEPGGHINAVFRLRHKNNTWLWIEAVATNLLDEPSVKAIVVNYRDITERKRADALARESEERYRSLFEDSPIALWEEDFSAVKKHLGALREQGVTDFNQYFNLHPQAVNKCASLVKILDINKATIKLFGAAKKDDLLKSIAELMKDEPTQQFQNELVNIAEGKTIFGWKGVIKTLDQRLCNIDLSWRAVPDDENSLSRVIVSMIDITERKRAEEELRESEEKYRTIVETMTEGIWVVDKAWITTYVNPALAAMLGYTEDELLGRSPMEFVDREDTHKASLLMQRREKGITEKTEVGMRRKDNTIMLAQSTSVSLLNGKGEFAGGLSLVADITERTRMEAALIQSEQAHRTLFENVPVGLYRTTSDGYWLDVNPALIKMFGYADRESLLAVKVENLYVDPGMHENFYREILKDDILINLVSEFRKKDGSTFWAEDHIQIIRDQSGNPLFFEGSLIDITERLHAQVEIKNLAKFPDQNPDPIMRLNDKGIILYANKSSREILEDWKTEVGQVVPPSMLLKTLEVLETQAQQEIEVSLGLRVLSFIITPVIEEGYVNLYGRDITESKRSEAALHESEERFHSLFNRMMDGVYRSRHEGKFVDVNPAMVEMFGFSSKEEMLAVDIKNELYFEPEERGSHILDTGQEEMDVYRMRRKDGSEIWVEDHGSYVHDEQGKIIYHEGILRDISERRRSDNFLQTLNNAALATQPTTSPDEMFIAVSSELAKMGLSCAILVVDESGTNLIPKYLSYDPSAMRAAEKLAGIDRSTFHIPIKSVDAFRLPITDRQAVFLESISEVLQQALPAPVKMLAGQLTKLLKIPKTINAPMMMENKIIGLFSVQSKDLRASDVPAIVALTNQLAASWHRSQLYEFTQKEIEERKLSEVALRESEERYRLLVEALPDGAVIHSQGLVIYANPASAEIMGASSSADLIGMPVIEFVHPDYREEVLKRTGQALHNSLSIPKAEDKFLRLDGNLVDVEVSAIPFSYGGKPVWLTVFNDITERKRVVEALLESEDKYRNLVANSRDLIWSVDAEGIITYINPVAQELYGFSAEEMIGRSFFDVMVPESYHMDLEMFRQEIAQQDKFINVESLVRHRDGRQFMLSASSTVLHDSAGHAIGLSGISRDITERKRIETALQESERRFQLASWATKDVIWERNLLTNMIEWNESLRKIFHFPIEEIEATAEWWQDHIHPAEQSNVMTSIQSAIENRQDFWSKEYRFRLFDGSYAHIFDRGYILYNEQGQPLQMIGAMIDISERKQAEAALRESEHRYRALFEHMPIAIWEQDFSEVKKHLDSLMEGGVTDFRAYFKSNPAALLECNAMIKVLDVNQATLNLYHADSKDALINSVAEIPNDRLMDQISDVLTAIAEGKSHHTWEGADETVTGTSIEISLSWSVAPGNENDFSKVIVTTIDITKRKVAEEALRASEAQFRAIFEGAAIGMALVDATGHPVKNNSALQEMLGYDSEELLNMVFTDFTHPDDAMTDWTLWQELIAGKRDRYQIEKRFIHKTGRVIWAKLATSIVPDADGQILFGVGMVEDITERKNHEREREALASVTRALDQDLDLDVLLQNLLDAALNAVPMAEKGAILLIDADGTLRIRSLNGYQDPRILTAGFPSNSGYSARAVRERQPLIIADARSDTSILYDDEIEEIREIQSAVVAPLIVQGRAIGAISLDNVTRKEAFGESELTLLSTFANSAALVIQNTRLLEETSQRVVELELLYESGLAISQLLNPKEIARKIMDLLEQKMNWHHTAIRLYNAADDTLELLAFYQPNIKNDEERVAMEKRFNTMVSHSGEGLSGWVVQHGESVRTGDLINDDRYVETFAGLHSGLYIPIKIGEHTIGVISIESEKENAFSRSDEQLTTILAAQAASIFENARLYDDIRHRAAELEQRVAERTTQIEVAKRRLELATSAGQIGVWEYNPMQNKVIWDERMYAIHQVRADKFDSTSQAWAQIIHPNDLDESQINDPLAFTQNLLLNNEHRIILPDGSIRHINTNAVAVANEDGTPERVIGISIDITERKQIEISLRESENYARLLFDAVPDPVSVNDINGITVDINKVFENQFNVTRSDMRGKRISEIGIYPESELEKRQKYMDEILQGKTADPIELDYYVPGDRLHTLELHAYPLKVNGRQLVLNTSHDITLHKKAEETQRLAKSEIERALRIKNEFLGNMSHELRTPLNSILGISESLEEQIVGALNEKQLKYVGIVRESGRHLLELINDILDLTKIEAGRMELDIHPITVEKLCQASLRMVKELAQKKSLNVTYVLNENVRIVTGDERRLKQCLVNLLSNAVKFTPPGSRIGLEVIGNTETNEVEFTVWDQGIGIDQKDIQYLFKPFVQLDAGLAREYQGSGLGLALVAQMINLHGGNVRVESEAGSGSRFMITLPWSLDEQIPKAKSTDKLLLTKLGSDKKYTSRILLVEDTDVVIQLISEYLRYRGHEVILAHNGLEAVRLAAQEHPDLILMDVMMPIMDGFEATQMIRKDESLQTIPIIALTALAMAGDSERCLAAGMNDYLSKPVQMQDLADMIEKYMGPALESTHDQ